MGDIHRCLGKREILAVQKSEVFVEHACADVQGVAFGIIGIDEY